MIEQMETLFLSYFKAGYNFSEAKQKLKQDSPNPGIETKIPFFLIQKYANGRHISESDWPDFAREIIEKRGL